MVNQTALPEEMSCIVIGGVADGSFIKAMRPGAQLIELSRPAFRKPLVSSLQEKVEVETEKDLYDVHPIGLYNSDSTIAHVLGIAVVQGQSLTWGFQELIVSYAQKSIADANEKEVMHD